MARKPSYDDLVAILRELADSMNYGERRDRVLALLAQIEDR